MLILVSFLICCTSVFTAEVCYPPYGCFNNHAPYDEALVQLPYGPDDLKTQFLFYSRQNLTHPTGVIKEFDVKGATNVGFDANKPTVFLTHGYIENRRRFWVQPFIYELLNYEDVNLIFVEWHMGAAFPYHQAVGNTRMVGAQISHLIEVIRNDTGINWPRMRLIGFSLGAHVVGYAGRNLRRKGMIVKQISAVDPASPYFENKHPDRRIDPTDAEFVDVIHTDSKTLVVNGFGTVQEMGHIDFYPNGGHDQPGCGLTIASILDTSIVERFACNHYRSMRFYIESINSPCSYHAYPCPNFDDFKNGLCSHCPKDGCPRMGYHVAKPKTDSSLKFYSTTNEKYPFCAFHYKIEFRTGSGFLNDLDGSVTIELTGSKGVEEVTFNGNYYNHGSAESRMFTLQTDIGTPQKIRVKHDRIIDIWFLETVTVRLMSSFDTYVGCFNRWLNNSKNQVDLYSGEANHCKGYKK